MSLVQAMKKETNNTKTTNGMKAKVSTLNACVDLFASIGASRGKNILPAFSAAYAEDQDKAVRIALWARDVRSGAGERQVVKDILKHLACTDYTTALAVLPHIPELGRWDDLLALVGTPAQKEAFDLIAKGLREGNGLCAKWMPRKGAIAEALRKHLEFSPKQYRKTLVSLTQVVETQMCSKNWTEIEYSKVPSLASARYQKAFGRNDQERYAAYLAALQKGEVKINAGAVYPYDVVKSVGHGISAMADQQWKALPNYIPEGVNILPVVDVSGSMGCPAGGNVNLSCMDVAIALGLYTCERVTGPFKDHFITFSERPALQAVKGSLSQRVHQLRQANWGYNTNLEAVFDLVLNTATKNNLPQSDIPQVVVIFSDMQFDKANGNKTAFGMIKKKFKDAGYECPQLVFWNLNASGNFPTTFDKEGVALVSGFSPSLMRSILGQKTTTPEDMMNEVIMVDRYKWSA